MKKLLGRLVEIGEENRLKEERVKKEAKDKIKTSTDKNTSKINKFEKHN